MKARLKLLLSIAQVTIAATAISQNIAINSTGNLPDTSAMLDVSSTVKGFLAPRMTTAQQNAIILPATGLIVYNTSTNTLNVNVGTANAPSWSTVSFGNSSSGNSSGSTGWGLTGNGSTNPSTNFIGTTDAQALVFKVNNVQAGYLGHTYTYSTAFGYNSYAAYGSTALGYNAQATGLNNSIAVGYNSTASKQDAIAIGENAQAKGGNNAIAIGYNAVGGYTNAIAIGNAAAASSTTNNNQTIAIGNSANANSYQGIAIGTNASTTSNNQTMAIGVGATASGFQATAIGNGASATAQNSTAIGNGASVSNANYISIGNTSVTAIRGQVNFTTFSDGRFKKNIKEDVHGLDFIMKLRPVTYNWDIHKFNEHAKGNEYELYNAAYSESDEEAILAKEKITYTGFIAQEVEQAAIRSHFNFSGVLKPVDYKDAYSLSYAEFVVPLVKATQELNNKINEQQKLIEKLITEVKDLKKEVH